jgi:hypothetical protein
MVRSRENLLNREMIASIVIDGRTAVSGIWILCIVIEQATCNIFPRPIHGERDEGFQTFAI